jgi:hypothetical protein
VAKRVRVWPPFYARLALVCSVEQELEIVGRRLPAIEATFAEGWDTECQLVPGRGPEWRFVAVVLDSGVLAAIFARQSSTDSDTVEIRNITIMPHP